MLPSATQFAPQLSLPHRHLRPAAHGRASLALRRRVACILPLILDQAKLDNHLRHLPPHPLRLRPFAVLVTFDAFANERFLGSVPQRDEQDPLRSGSAAALESSPFGRISTPDRSLHRHTSCLPRLRPQLLHRGSSGWQPFADTFLPVLLRFPLLRQPVRLLLVIAEAAKVARAAPNVRHLRHHLLCLAQRLPRHSCRLPELAHRGGRLIRLASFNRFSSAIAAAEPLSRPCSALARSPPLLLRLGTGWDQGPHRQDSDQGSWLARVLAADALPFALPVLPPALLMVGAAHQSPAFEQDHLPRASDPLSFAAIAGGSIGHFGTWAAPTTAAGDTQPCPSSNCHTAAFVAAGEWAHCWAWRMLTGLDARSRAEVLDNYNSSSRREALPMPSAVPSLTHRPCS